MVIFKQKLLNNLTEVCDALLVFTKQNHIVCFKGTMGSGKTTLIKEFCRYIGCLDHVSSPTYSLVNEYLLPNNSKVYHFDFYRINDAEEALNFGVEEYFYSNNLCLIEWGENIEKYLPNPYIKVTIEQENEHRNYIIKLIQQ
jgi:tRNA threonylcarbamoyladenosine biosynthesis protein TsaE